MLCRNSGQAFTKHVWNHRQNAKPQAWFRGNSMDSNHTHHDKGEKLSSFFMKTRRKFFRIYFWLLYDFENLDQEELTEFFSSYDSKWLPTKENFVTRIKDNAHKESVQKPAFKTKWFANCLQISSCFSSEEFFAVYSKLKPTVKNCLTKITTEHEEKTVLSFLKKYLRETDEKMRRALFRFCTGVDLRIKNILVIFNNLKGIERMLTAHTCSGFIQLPCTYEDFVQFRCEMNAILNGL